MKSKLTESQHSDICKKPISLLNVKNGATKIRHELHTQHVSKSILKLAWRTPDFKQTLIAFDFERPRARIYASE